MKLTHVKPIGLGSVMLAVLRREISLAMRQKGEVLTPLVFFAVVASLFPWASGRSRRFCCAWLPVFCG